MISFILLLQTVTNSSRRCYQYSFFSHNMAIEQYLINTGNSIIVNYDVDHDNDCQLNMS